MRHFCSLSEAIREGIKLSPSQTFHAFYDPETGGSCANGAALWAIFGHPFTNDLLQEKQSEVAAVLRADYLYLKNAYVHLPCLCTYLVSGPSDVDPEGQVHRLDHIVVHLNNYHQWTRESIADWLESEEEKLGFVIIAEEAVGHVERVAK